MIHEITLAIEELVASFSHLGRRRKLRALAGPAILSVSLLVALVAVVGFAFAVPHVRPVAPSVVDPAAALAQPAPVAPSAATAAVPSTNIAPIAPATTPTAPAPAPVVQAPAPVAPAPVRVAPAPAPVKKAAPKVAASKTSGKALLNKYCSSCHSVRLSTSTRTSASGWSSKISSMVGRMPSRDKAALIAYLKAL